MVETWKFEAFSLVIPDIRYSYGEVIFKDQAEDLKVRGMEVYAFEGAIERMVQRECNHVDCPSPPLINFSTILQKMKSLSQVSELVGSFSLMFKSIAALCDESQCK